MPQVPYRPVANAPSFIATPSISRNTPVEAFGGATAEGLQHLGQVAGQVGNEIFSRATALQDLQNEVDADNAVTDYMMKSSQLHADFGALQGEAKAKAFPKYIEDVQKLREDIGNGLSNPAVQRSYNRNSRQFMGREIFNGAGQAAVAQKQAAFNAASSRVDTVRNTLTNPADDVGFASKVNETTQYMQKQAVLGGWSEDETNNRTGHAISQLWAQRIGVLAQTQPFAAQKMLDQAKTDNRLRQDDFDKVQKQVQQFTHTVGARNISEAVNQGWAPYMTQDQIARSTGVEPALLAVVKEAQRAHPELQFVIGGQGGRRSQAEQDALYAQGRTAPGRVVTWTRDSNHLRGVAVDLEPIRGTSAQVDAAMAEASEKLGIPLGDVSRLRAKGDSGHFELPRDYDVTTAPKLPEESLASREARARTYAQSTAPDDSTFDEYTVQRVRTDFAQAQAVRRDTEWRAGNTIDGAIVGLHGNGKLPTTVEELKNISPEVSSAWNDLSESKQRKYLSYLTRNAKGDVGWTPEGAKRYQQLIGMAESDPSAFLDVDVLAENVPMSRRIELVKLQQRKKNNIEANPALRGAMSMLQPLLGPADLARRNDSNKDRYDQFVGALQDQLQQFAHDNPGKVPKLDDINKMGAQLLQDQATPWWANPWSKTPMFEVPVPQADADRIKGDPRWLKAGITPTPQMIQRVFTAEQFQKLYGKSVSSEDQPQVPRR